LNYGAENEEPEGKEKNIKHKKEISSPVLIDMAVAIEQPHC
jgi:hypothetical protein